MGPPAFSHYSDVIMGAMASKITSITIVYSTASLGADQRKHQRSASLAFVRVIHRSPVNSPHKWPVTQKMFPCGDVILVMSLYWSGPRNAAIYREISLGTSVSEGMVLVWLAMTSSESLTKLAMKKAAPFNISWWRHQMKTFSALLAFCAGNSPVTGEFPSQRPVTRSFDFFLWSAPKQTLVQTIETPVIETPSCSLWCHCNGHRSLSVTFDFHSIYA